METRNVTLPSGATAILKAGITGRDKRKLLAPFKNAVEVKPSFDGSAPELISKNFDGAALDQAEDVLITTVVLELNGSSEDILNRVLDLAAADFDALKAELDKAQKGFFSLPTT